ncbi:DNA-binding domain-containing protein [Inquilinus limosus]|uniref:HvfC/BufC N-terminal domain-containing protein n=1 Tax=Inquilinus limosus TaxID=171674 RepID=UPI003F181E2D
MPRRLRDIQAAFSAAIMDPAAQLPEGVIGRDGMCGGRRVSAYRNNVFAGLVKVLAARFPVTERLIGGAFFQAMARLFVAGHLPRSPVLLWYGDEFPDFISCFGPARFVPYLADVARLELAWSQACHAAEATPLAIDALTSRPPDVLLEAQLTLHPSVRLVRSVYPVATIWAAHQDGGRIVPPRPWEAEDVLVLRPDAEVLLYRLPAGVFAFASALLRGASLAAAAEDAIAEGEGFDLGQDLVGLFETGAIVAVSIPDQDGDAS